MNVKPAASIVLAVALSAMVGCAQQKQEEPAKEEATQEEVVQEVKEEPKAEEQKNDNAFSNEAPESAPYIKEGGWSYIEGVNGSSVNVALILGNTDTTNCYIFPKVKATAKSADGSVVAFDTASTTFIAPNDVMPLVFKLTGLSEEPATIDFEFSAGEKQVPGNDYTLSDLPSSGVSETITDREAKWLGEYSNNTGVTFPNGVTPIVVLRSNGQIVAGFENLLDRIESADGATSSFEVKSFPGSVPEHDSFEAYIVPNLV